MKIEAIDPIRATDEDGNDIRMEPGDQLTVSEQFGRLACEHGWARDLSGEVPTGEKSTQPVTVTPQGTRG